VRPQVLEARKRLVALAAPEQFLGVDGAAVSSQAARRRELFAADAARQRFVARVTSLVLRQVHITRTTLAAFRAPVSAAVNIHMPAQSAGSRKTLLAQQTWVQASAATRYNRYFPLRSANFHKHCIT